MYTNIETLYIYTHIYIYIYITFVCTLCLNTGHCGEGCGDEEGAGKDARQTGGRENTTGTPRHQRCVQPFLK
jgi:hypothetical protein